MTYERGFRKNEFGWSRVARERLRLDSRYRRYFDFYPVDKDLRSFSHLYPSSEFDFVDPPANDAS